MPRSSCHRPRRALRCATAVVLALQLGGCALLEREEPGEPLYPVPAPAEVDWRDLAVRGLQPLEHERGDRWPLVLWEGVGYDSLPPESIEAMLERGVVQHLRLSEPDIEAARALANAGAPVILMEGKAGAWPYDAGQDDASWRLQFPAGADVPEQWRRLPDPTRLDGWRRAGELTRSRLQVYDSEGITVDGVWLDYEGALLNDDYHALRASHAAANLPAAILDNEHLYRKYRRIHWLHRLSRYLAAPIRRVYPEASVTNWVVMMSSSLHPVAGWTDWEHPPSPPLFFTHTNPIAYGIDTYFRFAWPRDHEINRENVDRFYMHLLLRQVSVDAINRRKHRPDLEALAWVARWVPDRADQRTPIMSRAAYREALRHIWLRGVDGMQVFNPARDGYERYALHEVQDVQQVYDEMLAYREFLERGEVMNLDVPGNRDATLVWSGLRLGERAVVRVSNLGADQEVLYVCLDDDSCMNLPIPRGGRTFELTF